MTDMVIKPKNWAEFQHYKDRNPPWIKLHKTLLDNYEFHSLQLASKALAPCYWLIASEHKDGLIMVNEKKLAWRFRVTEKIINETVKELISSGFFELVQDDSSVLAGRYQDAMPETETETETDKKKILKKKISFSFETGQWSNVYDNEALMGSWRKAYPRVNLTDELTRAAAWLMANPRNKKSNYERFLNNWFSRAQENITAKNQAAGNGGMNFKWI